MRTDLVDPVNDPPPANRRHLLVTGVVALLEAAYFAVSLRTIGFPDGHRTALDRFHERAWPVSIVALLLTAVWAFARAARPRASRAPLVVAMVTALACIVVEVLAAGSFDHGAGG